MQILSINIQSTNCAKIRRHACASDKFHLKSMRSFAVLLNAPHSWLVITVCEVKRLKSVTKLQCQGRFFLSGERAFLPVYPPHHVQDGRTRKDLPAGQYASRMGQYDLSTLHYQYSTVEHA